MNKIMSFFTTNILWKVTALLMSMILWFLAYNIENPMRYQNFYSVNLELRSLEELARYDLVLLNQEEIENKTVTVGVLANIKLLSQLSSSDITAYVDMSPVSFSYAERILQDLTAPVEIEFPVSIANGVSSSAPNPSKQSIVLDRLETRQFPVAVVKTQDVPEGYISMEPSASPETVSIKGPSSVLDTVQSVRVEVSLNEAYTDYAATAAPHIYDADNNDITESLTILDNSKEIDVNIQVNKHALIPVAYPVITGYTAPGYTITDVYMDISSVEVVGKDEEIGTVDQIILAPIDVTGLNQTVEIVRDVRDFLRDTPLGIRNGTPYEVRVTVEISREITRRLTVPLTRIDVTGNHPEAEIADNFEITVRGAEALVNELNGDSITGSIDLTDLEPGEYDWEVDLRLSEGIALENGPALIKVIIPETAGDEEDEEGEEINQGEGIDGSENNGSENDGENSENVSEGNEDGNEEENDVEDIGENDVNDSNEEEMLGEEGTEEEPATDGDTL